MLSTFLKPHLLAFKCVIEPLLRLKFDIPYLNSRSFLRKVSWTWSKQLSKDRQFSEFRVRSFFFSIVLVWCMWTFASPAQNFQDRFSILIFFNSTKYRVSFPLNIGYIPLNIGYHFPSYWGWNPRNYKTFIFGPEW